MQKQCGEWYCEHPTGQTGITSPHLLVGLVTGCEDPVVQPPSGNPQDLDSSHANGTTLVGRTGILSCLLCPQWFTKTQASKFKEKRKTVSLFHAKRNCRIACWNVRTLGPLSPQSLPLTSVLRTMQERNIEVLAVYEYRWTGQGVTKIGSYTILHSGTPSRQVHGVALSSAPKQFPNGRLLAVLFSLFSSASSEFV